MSTTLLSPLLWSFVPSQLTHILLPYLVSTFPGLFLPSPRGSPTYAYNYRIVYTLVVTAYLVYSFVGQGGGGQDWYALLQVARTADDEVIKKAFRSLQVVTLPHARDELLIYVILCIDRENIIRIEQAINMKVYSSSFVRHTKDSSIPSSDMPTTGEGRVLVHNET